MIGNIKENSKPFWKYISSKKKDTQSIPPLNTKQGTTAESDVDKTEALNDQYWSIYQENRRPSSITREKNTKNEGYTDHRRRRFKITSKFKYIESMWSR